jgi:hypothetical protein
LGRTYWAIHNDFKVGKLPISSIDGKIPNTAQGTFLPYSILSLHAVFKIFGEARSLSFHAKQ